MTNLDPAGTGAAPEVVVVGSVNLDLSIQVERFPDPGETVLGGGVNRGGGGKGANQAVAAARLGRRVALVGRVGDDSDGSHLVATLGSEGIDVSSVMATVDVPTGLALIEVDPSGENRIVVVPGANGRVEIGDLDSAGAAIDQAAVVVTQLEIPVLVVEALAARDRRGTLILNPAPALPVALAGVDLLVPNRSELAVLAGAGEATSIDEVVDQLLALPERPGAAVVTLGADGALVVEDLGGPSMSVVEVAAHPVRVVDTTGAGDAFCGGLADALCLGADVAEAARWAARVAASAVTRPGAWSALPRRSELIR